MHGGFSVVRLVPGRFSSARNLDSSLNSMATVTTLDFYDKFAKKDGTPSTT